MKKTININLGGQPFIIDEQAYDILHSYFEALKQKFTNEDERKEILSDIEARVAEVFSQRLGKTRAVVNEEDVVYIISLMGKPEDIAGESEAPAGAAGPKSTFTTSSSTTIKGTAEKKLFRDPDNKKVGGVISGLCHYFGWGDPTWIRVVLVGIILLSIFAKLGIGFPIAVIYLILLIVVPEATSSSEKLQMRGEPVTIQNIEKEVRDAMTTAGSSINKLVKDNDTGGKVANLAMMIARAFAKIVLVFVILICMVLMLALVTVFFSLSILSSSSLAELTHLVVSNHYTIMLFNIGLILTIGIPLVSIMYDSIRFMTNSQVQNPGLRRVLWGGWFIGIILLAITSWSVCRNFAATDTSNQKVQLLTPHGGTLRVQLADTLGHALDIKSGDDQEVSSFFHVEGFGMSKTGLGFSFSDLKLEVAVSPDSNFYVEKVAFSRGANFADAEKNNQMVQYKFSQTDTTLNLDNKFEIPKTGKWRGQKLKLRIYVPEGKRIVFADDENLDQMEAWVKGNDYFDDGMLSGRVLEVENGKIKCLNCKEKVIDEENADDQDDAEASDSTKGKVIMETVQGHDSLKNVSVRINQNGVSMTGKNEKDERVKVKIDNKGIKVITVDSVGNTKIKRN